MITPIEVKVQNLSTGQEVIRTFYSKNEALMKTNTLVVQMLSKYNTEEIFVRYRQINLEVSSDQVEDLPF